MDDDTENTDLHTELKEIEAERRILMLDLAGFICASLGVFAAGAALFGIRDTTYWQTLIWTPVAVLLISVARRNWKKAKELVEARALVLNKTLPQFPKEEDEVDEDPPPLH